MDNTTDTKILTGTRLICPTNGSGTVYALHYELLEDIAQVARNICRDRVVVDIVFDQGGIARDVPEEVVRQCGWEIEDVVVSPESIARSLTLAACATAARSAANAQQLAAYFAYNEEIERLKAAPEYHHLDQGNDPHSGILAARNIRATLRLVFPGTRFSVRRTACGTVTVNYKDGPCVEQVGDAVRRYRAGRYNANAGAYEYSRQPWTAVFGGAKYVNVVHEESDELVEAAIGALFAKFPEILAGVARPSVSQYKGGGLCDVKVPLFDESLQKLLRLQIGLMTR